MGGTYTTPVLADVVAETGGVVSAMLRHMCCIAMLAKTTREGTSHSKVLGDPITC